MWGQVGGMQFLTAKFEVSTSLRRGLLAVTLLMTFRVFQFFPGMAYVEESWFVLCFLALVSVYPIWKTARGLRFSTFELYVLALTVIDVVLPAWSAKREFGQPLIYGILTQRGAALLVVPLLFLNAVRSRRISPRDIEVALLACAWGTFFVFLAMRLFLNPANFTSYGVGFAQYINGKAVFSLGLLDGCFFLFGIVYYALMGFRTRRVKYYLAAAIFFTGMYTETSGRGSIMSLTLALLYFLYRWRPLKQFLFTGVKFAALVTIVLTIVYVANPAYLSTRIAGFGDAFAVTFTGAEVNDPSANGRLFETLAALPLIQKHPLLGNGAISRQWEGGTRTAMGVNFFAGDIGIIGVLFTVGVLGFLVFGYQFLFALRAKRMLPDSSPSSLSDATAGFVLFLAIDSLMTGLCMSDSEVTLFFIALLMGLAYVENGRYHGSIQSDPMNHPLDSSRALQTIAS